MKSKKYIITAIIAVISGVFTYAQSHDHSQMATVKTETIEVLGRCDMCKVRIEKAAKIDGVSKAEWNSDTRILTLVYNPALTSSDKIQKNIAAVGHDTEKFKASDEVYKKLPACCRYERSK